ncbi:GAF domain-containing sensor histidine kinase [Thalassobacillus hwangdonensis]|uniref:histidine kinase n=1 Tax=Thalassobacillus hwangdonensis TaxID=546108 RepID=A0ABW3KUW0_9BACI
MEKAKLQTLKHIAELLNRSSKKHDTLHNVLQEFIAISKFETGWIFLEENGKVSLVADRSLPPALKRNDKALMCGEDCYCISKYKKGLLKSATNVIGCKRIEEAHTYGDEATCGLTHHATVPLKTPSQSFGLLNVAMPGTETYTEELELLESIALQIGSALERIHQFELEEVRNELLSSAHTIANSFQSAGDPDQLKVLFEAELHTLFKVDSFIWGNGGSPYEEILHSITPWGPVYLSRAQPFLPFEKETFDMLVQYADVAKRRLDLMEKEKDLVRIEERSKLGQDLHDSISQLLFSIVLTSKALKQQGKDTELTEQISYIHELSSEALKEMRALISEQKHRNLREGLLAELKRYAKLLGLSVTSHSSGTTTIPYAIEEALLRIGQESLHNVKQHAGTDHISIRLDKGKDCIALWLQDDGCGFDMNHIHSSPSFGIKGMQERVKLYDGALNIESNRGEGTIIKVSIPIKGGAG